MIEKKKKILAEKILNTNKLKMIKKLLLTYLFLNSLLSFSQEIVSSTVVDLKKNRDVFQTINEDKKEVTLFVSDKVKVKAIRLNEKMQIVDSISTERPTTKMYSSMIGYNINNDNTRLFWASNDYEDVFTQLYDFNSRKIVTQQYTLLFKNEKILQKFSGNENFYILSVIKKSNNFKLHVFDKEGNHKEQIINLDGFRFFRYGYTRTDLYGVFEENLLPFEIPFTLQNINVKNPTSLTDAAKKRKCYFDNKQIVITLDANIDYTQVIRIDLERFIATEKMVKKHTIGASERYYLNSNSFFFDNKLYQVKTSSDLFYFTIKDLDDNIIKEYFANAANPIEFKNSEIYQEGGDFGGGKRTLENTSQFIRKINNLNTAVSCYHIGQSTLITFGGVSAAQQTGGQVAMSQFGLIGAIAGAAFFSPTMENFNSYSNKKVVKIESLFDSEGNHIKGDLQPLAFDKIRTFFDDNKDVSSQTLFKTDSYYLGYYDNKSKEYIIRKFVD